MGLGSPLGSSACDMDEIPEEINLDLAKKTPRVEAESIVDLSLEPEDSWSIYQHI